MRLSQRVHQQAACLLADELFAVLAGHARLAPLCRFIHRNDIASKIISRLQRNAALPYVVDCFKKACTRPMRDWARLWLPVVSAQKELLEGRALRLLLQGHCGKARQG